MKPKPPVGNIEIEGVGVSKDGKVPKWAYPLQKVIAALAGLAIVGAIVVVWCIVLKVVQS